MLLLCCMAWLLQLLQPHAAAAAGNAPPGSLTHSPLLLRLLPTVRPRPRAITPLSLSLSLSWHSPRRRGRGLEDPRPARPVRRRSPGDPRHDPRPRAGPGGRARLAAARGRRDDAHGACCCSGRRRQLRVQVSGPSVQRRARQKFMYVCFTTAPSCALPPPHFFFITAVNSISRVLFCVPLVEVCLTSGHKNKMLDPPISVYIVLGHASARQRRAARSAFSHITDSK